MVAALGQPEAPQPGRDREAVLEGIVHRHAVEALVSQIETERKDKARMAVRDLAVVALILGATFGSSYALARYVRLPRRVRISRR